jgi:YgiT-type zinc finger domain-containing protein
MDDQERHCPSCDGGTLRPGPATLEGGREGVTVRISGIPADVCDHCGEFLMDGDLAVEISASIERIIGAVERHKAADAMAAAPVG